MRVLQSFREGRPMTNPYLVQLVTALRPRTVVYGFSWRRALSGRPNGGDAPSPAVLDDQTLIFRSRSSSAGAD